ncbi:MAG: hypothetical protein V4543_13470 [Bacteroidota bacterium]
MEKQAYSPTEAEIKRSHFKNLVSMALADRKLAPEEIDMLRMLGVKHGLSEEELHNLLFSRAEMGEHHPKSGKDKIIFLYDLVRMMLIDENLSSNEFDLSVRIAGLYGYGPDLIAAMINTYAAGTTSAEARASILESLDRFVKALPEGSIGTGTNTDGTFSNSAS